MASKDQSSSYEELRNKNVERNMDTMRTLGLLPLRCENEQELHASIKQRSPKNSQGREKQPQRSDRIATVGKSSSPCREGLPSFNTNVCGSHTDSEGKRRSSKCTVPVSFVSKDVEVRERKFNMGNSDMHDGYNTDVSTDSMYAVEFQVGGASSGNVPESLLEKETGVKGVGPLSGAFTSEAVQTQLAAAFNKQFEDMIYRALMHSTGALSGLSKAGQPGPQDLSLQKESPTIDGSEEPKTWSDWTYNIVKARRRRETRITRTSAGEGSDSQKEFPILENESPQQRAMRTRRLNRFRKKRALDLTENRKAFEKRPYVLHVDGMAKAKGIHKHLWRVALRGQCGQLDPTMDNINHHPKHIVDSIWQALQKEWEFEGFTHRAREMFERSATKFMRNRKMQLKYKCKKIVDDSKPDDVNGMHWKKIVLATKKATESLRTSKVNGSTSKGTEKLPMPVQGQGPEENSKQEEIPECLPCRSDDCPPNDGQIMSTEAADVDARIRSLQSELLRLQNSREVNMYGSVDEGKVGFKVVGSIACDGNETVTEHEGGKKMDIVFEAMKENVKPMNMNCNSLGRSVIEKNMTHEDRVQASMALNDRGKKVANAAEEVKAIEKTQESCVTVEDEEMDCGDVVRVYAYTAGIKEEIEKSIVMGLARSKFAKKVIPQAWRSIKITSWTAFGASKICPFPLGWIEQLKSKIVKEVNGQSILWPDMLLRSL